MYLDNHHIDHLDLWTTQFKEFSPNVNNSDCRDRKKEEREREQNVVILVKEKHYFSELIWPISVVAVVLMLLIAIACVGLKVSMDSRNNKQFIEWNMFPDNALWETNPKSITSRQEASNTSVCYGLGPRFSWVCCQGEKNPKYVNYKIIPIWHNYSFHSYFC